MKRYIALQGSFMGGTRICELHTYSRKAPKDDILNTSSMRGMCFLHILDCCLIISRENANELLRKRDEDYGNRVFSLTN